MADLSITAANVAPSGSTPPQLQYVQFGEAVTQGQAVYFNSATSKWLKADANASSTTANAGGVVMTPASSDGYGYIFLNESTINLGATLTTGVDYYLSNTAGGICPRADLTSSSSYVTRIGYATSASVFVVEVKPLGVLAS